jgi:hypothetical protein
VRQSPGGKVTTGTIGSATLGTAISQ